MSASDTLLAVVIYGAVAATFVAIAALMLLTWLSTRTTDEQPGDDAVGRSFLRAVRVVHVAGVVGLGALFALHLAQPGA